MMDTADQVLVMNAKTAHKKVGFEFKKKGEPTVVKLKGIGNRSINA